MTRPSGKKIHGSILGSRFAFAEDRFGSSARSRLVNALPMKERDKIKSPVFENNWYDFETLDTIDRYIVNTLGGGDERLLHELGRFSADYNYSRLPAKLQNLPPEELLQNATRFNVIFQDSGTFTYEQIKTPEGEQGLALIYTYPEDIPESYFASGVGFFERLVELSGHRVKYAGGEQKIVDGACHHRYEICWERTPLPERPKPLKIKAGEVRAEESVETENSSQSISTSTSKSISPIAQAVRNEFDEKFATASIVPSDKPKVKKKAPRWRIWTLSVLTALGALFLIVQQAYLYATAEPEPVTQDKIYNYSCSGSLQVELQLDKPSLVVAPAVAVEELRLEVESEELKYSYKTGKIAQGMKVEIPLNALQTAQKSALSSEAVPKGLELTAKTLAGEKSCSCLLQN